MVMSLRDAVQSLGLQWPRNKKLRCPFHNEKDGSLHLYEKTNSWTCFSCHATGDSYGLIAAISGEEIGSVLRRYKKGVVTTKPAKTYLLREKLERQARVISQPLFDAIRNSLTLESWQQELLLARASDWWDAKKEELADLPPSELNRAIMATKAEALRLREEWKVNE